jgi:beta-glucosidase-like glycosyl hydrolase
MAARRWSVLASLLLAFSALAADEIESMIATMSLEEKVGQMTQVDISLVLTEKKLDMAKLRYWLSSKKLGSILNSPYSGRDCGSDGLTGLSAVEWREIIHAVQAEAQRLGVPPVLFGLDSIHGATYVRGATLFGQQLALAATFDRELVRKVGHVTARDTLAAGVPWLFSPILDLATQPAYPRVYETFGEDPYVVAELGIAMIEGIQSETEDPELPRAAACMKHFFGYAHPANGHDRGPVYLPEAALRTYYLPPFVAAVRRARVATAMNSYNELNGVPIAASRKWLRTVLRSELGFDGLLVTDWGEINNVHSFHHAAPSDEAAVLLAMNRTSIDMSMVPLDDGFIRHLVNLVRAGALPISRVDESVRRVLRLKGQLRLLETPVPSEHSPLLERVGKDTELALESARASVTLLANRGREPTSREPRPCAPLSADTGATDGHDVVSLMQWEVPDALACRDRCSTEPRCVTWVYQGSWLGEHPDWPICFLKNADAQLKPGADQRNNTAGTCEPAPRSPPLLPLNPSAGAKKRVLLTGPTAHSLSYQSGGWSVRWQGACADSDFEAGGETLRHALRRLLPADVQLEHTAGCTIHAASHATATCYIDSSDWNATLAAARASDVAVVALGEENYTEKPGDIDDLELHRGQLELVRRLAAAVPELPIVLVLISGRARLLRGLPQLSSVLAVVSGYVPGPHGGTALAEVLLGLVNPSGRLPITYPALPNALGPHWQTYSARCSGSSGGYLSGGTSDCPVEFPFGHGEASAFVLASISARLRSARAIARAAQRRSNAASARPCARVRADARASLPDRSPPLPTCPCPCPLALARSHQACRTPTSATARSAPSPQARWSTRYCTLRSARQLPHRARRGSHCARAPAALPPLGLTPAGAVRTTRPRRTQGKFAARLRVCNTGERDGRHSALLYCTQEWRTSGVAPEVRRLVGFAAATLAAGSCEDLEFQIPTDILTYYTEEMVATVEAGKYTLFAHTGKSEVRLDLHVVVSAARGGAGEAIAQAAETFALVTHTNPIYLPWLAIAICGAVLMTSCFICGAIAAGCVLRRRNGKTAGYLVSGKSSGGTELTQYSESRLALDDTGQAASDDASDLRMNTQRFRA